MTQDCTIRTYASKPPLGWNSFDCFGNVANERVLLENLDVFVEKLKPAGYEYFVLDIAWYQIHPTPEGDAFPNGKITVDRCLDGYGRYLPNPTYFPHGLKPIADRAHDLGVKFGIHVMRGIPRAAVDRNLPVLGTDICARDIADLESICPWNNDNYGVDMSKLGAQAYYDSVIALFAEWGVDYVKADDIVPYPAEIHGVASAIEGCGRPMVFSLSPGIEMRIDDIDVYKRANMVRITHDIWDRREDLDDAFDSWYLFQGCEDVGFWPDLDMIPFGKLAKARPRQGTAGEGVDLASGKGAERMSLLTDAQKRTFITQRALAASPLMMGGHLPETDDYSFDLITDPDMLACNQNGVMGRRCYKTRDWEVWGTPDRAVPGAGWLGVFNRTQGRQKIVVARSMLGLGDEDAYMMRDIWGRQRFQLTADTVGITLQDDDVLFLRYELA